MALNSPTHRATMLRPDYEETGVGVVLCPQTGVYYLTNVFCLRKKPRPFPP